MRRWNICATAGEWSEGDGYWSDRSSSGWLLSEKGVWSARENPASLRTKRDDRCVRWGRAHVSWVLKTETTKISPLRSDWITRLMIIVFYNEICQNGRVLCEPPENLHLNLLYSFKKELCRLNCVYRSWGGLMRMWKSIIWLQRKLHVG